MYDNNKQRLILSCYVESGAKITKGVENQNKSNLYCQPEWALIHLGGIL